MTKQIRITDAFYVSAPSINEVNKKANSLEKSGYIVDKNNPEIIKDEIAMKVFKVQTYFA